MYHIKKDKRSLTSADLIYQGLLACLAEKDFQNMTITDIHRESGVSRATFYRLFDDISDVLHWKCQQTYDDMLRTYLNLKEHHPSEKEFILFFFNYWMEHCTILELLLSLGRYDLIYKSHLSITSDLYAYFQTLYPQKLTHQDYYFSFRIGAFIGIIIQWLENDRQESAEELVDIIAEQIALVSHQKMIF